MLLGLCDRVMGCACVTCVAMDCVCSTDGVMDCVCLTDEVTDCVSHYADVYHIDVELLRV